MQHISNRASRNILKNHTIEAITDHVTTVARCDDRKFPPLRFQLRQPKAIGECRKYEDIRIFVITVDGGARRHPKPADLRMQSQLLRNADLRWTDKPELDVFTWQQLHGLEQLCS